MGVYIKGLEMPKAGLSTTINIHADGTVYVYGTYPTETHKAVPVPPHGDLIDRDALMDSDGDLWDGMWGWSGVQIANAPTIIGAEEVFGQHTDTAGNFHWCGTHSGEHKIKVEECE